MWLFGPNLPKKGSYFQFKTDKIDTAIELCIFELVFVSIFTLNKQFWIFGPNLPKKHICSKTEKVNTIIDICIFKLILVPNFSLNWQFWPDLPKKGFSGQNQRKWTQLILHIQISLMCEISAQTDNFDFLDQICRRYFQSKTESEHHHQIPHIQISLGTKFSLKLKILIYWTDLPKKGFSGLKQKKWTPHVIYTILHIQISLVWNFSSNSQFWFFGPNLPKKAFPAENRKREYHHWILHIWISLGTKFQLKLIILGFWIKFTQKRYFQSKTDKVNITNEFCIFELV